jgi:predicted MFS family arabinose efflux permease
MSAADTRADPGPMTADTDRARRALLWASGAGFLGFYLQLAAVPALAADAGGDAAAGVLTAALMLATVAGQAAVPALLRRWSASSVLVAGLLLLGLPTLIYAASPGVIGLVAVTVVRGVGFGLMTVVGSLLVARFAADDARGRALGLYGLVTSVSGAFAPAAGLALVHRSPALAALVAAVPSSAAAVVALVRLPRTRERAGGARLRGSLSGYAAAVLVFLPATAAFGGVYSYVPLLDGDRGPWLLVVFGVGYCLGRVAPGHVIDRGVSAAAISAWVVPVAAAGLALLALDGPAWTAGLGTALAALAVGVLSTTTLLIMVAHGTGARDAQAAALWNMTFDAGGGIGGIALGVVAAGLGVPIVFAVAAGGMLAVSLPAALVAVRQGRAA